MTTEETTEVVTSFLMRRVDDRDELLVLRRGGRVGTYRGRWAGVSGHVEHPPDEQARIEIAEEVGLGPEDIALVRKGAPLDVLDEAIGRHWVVYPYLFTVIHPERIRLDWEHTEARWIPPAELASYDTVPMLKEALARVYPGNAAEAGVSEQGMDS